MSSTYYDCENYENKSFYSYNRSNQGNSLSNNNSINNNSEIRYKTSININKNSLSLISNLQKIKTLYTNAKSMESMNFYNHAIKDYDLCLQLVELVLEEVKNSKIPKHKISSKSDKFDFIENDIYFDSIHNSIEYPNKSSKIDTLNDLGIDYNNLKFLKQNLIINLNHLENNSNTNKNNNNNSNNINNSNNKGIDETKSSINTNILSNNQSNIIRQEYIEFSKDKIKILNVLLNKINDCIGDLKATLENINPKYSTSFMLLGASMQYGIIDNSEINDSTYHNTQLLFKMMQHLLLMQKYISNSIKYFSTEYNVHSKYDEYVKKLDKIRKYYELLKKASSSLSSKANFINTEKKIFENMLHTQKLEKELSLKNKEDRTFVAECTCQSIF